MLERAEPPNPTSSGARIAEAVDRLHNYPTSLAHRRFTLAAETQVTLGEYHAAVISAATSCEHLLENVLSLLLWESNWTPEKGAELLRRPLDARARALGDRLGGEWSPRGDGPFGDWHYGVRQVRNAAIHRGVEPTGMQAYRAVDVTRRISSYIGELLREPKNMERFPRTNAMYNPKLGFGSLAEALHDQPDEPDWLATSSRWQQACDVAVKGLKNWPVIADDDSAEIRVVALLVPTGVVKWAVWRPNDGVAMPIEKPVDISDAQAQSLITLCEAIDRPECAQLADVTPPPTTSNRLAPKGIWNLEYRLIPDFGVMLGQGDLDILLS